MGCSYQTSGIVGDLPHGIVKLVNDVLRGRREPGRKILDAVGIERITVYRLKKRDGAE